MIVAAGSQRQWLARGPAASALRLSEFGGERVRFCLGQPKAIRSTCGKSSLPKTMTDEQPSYIDYETFLDPSFSPISFANSLVLNTNNPSDISLDLSTPLSKVLFDVQEIDSHIHTLTTKNALPLLEYSQIQNDAAQKIVEEIEVQARNLSNGYERLEGEVIKRYETANEVRQTVERLWQTLKVGRAVARCLSLGRQLEAQMTEVSATSTAKKEDHKAMIRAATTLLHLRQLLASSGVGEEGENLSKINLITHLRTSVINPLESGLQSRAQQIVREFAMTSLATGPSGPTTYAQTEETKARTSSALLTLYLLSAQLQLASLQAYLRTALTSSLASITRALTNLPSLDRTLLEVSARCQNIVGLESLLENLKPMTKAVGGGTDVHETEDNFLDPLLASLDTSSLPSYFWRSLAEGLAGRVADMISRGGMNARTFRSHKDRIKESIRDCVIRGSQGPAGGRGREGVWEREAAVMVGSVVGAIGR